MSQNLSQSVSSQTVLCQNSEDIAFITPYLNSARTMLQQLTEKDMARDERKGGRTEKRRRNYGLNRDQLRFNNKRTSEYTENGDDGGKSQPLSTDDLVSIPVKKKKRDIECLSLTVSSSDLDDYGTSDDGDNSFVFDDIHANSCEEITIDSESSQIFSDTSNDQSVNKSRRSSNSSCSSSSTSGSDSSTTSSSSSSSSTSGESSSSNESNVSIKKKKRNEVTKNFSDYKENNKNGKKIVDLDSDLSDDEETDDGSEAHVVCFICGKYNRKKKFYHWISCTICKNWFHKDCTHLWKMKIKDIEKDNFICRYH